LESSGVFTLDGNQTSTVGLTRTISELTISDSAVSVDTEVKGKRTSKDTNQQHKNKEEDCVVPPLNLKALTSDPKDKVKQEGHALLETVCDELNKHEQTMVSKYISHCAYIL